MLGQRGIGLPRIRVALDGVARRGDGWRVRWRLRNGGPEPVTVLQAWHPHRRFRSSRLPRSVRIAAGASAAVDVPAHTDARMGEIVENCFLILRVRCGRAYFQVLARSTLTMGRDGVPRLRVTAVDAHAASR